MSKYLVNGCKAEVRKSLLKKGKNKPTKMKYKGISNY